MYFSSAPRPADTKEKEDKNLTTFQQVLLLLLLLPPPSPALLLPPPNFCTRNLSLKMPAHVDTSPPSCFRFCPAFGGVTSSSSTCTSVHFAVFIISISKSFFFFCYRHHHHLICIQICPFMIHVNHSAHTRTHTQAFTHTHTHTHTLTYAHTLANTFAYTLGCSSPAPAAAKSPSSLLLQRAER